MEQIEFTEGHYRRKCEALELHLGQLEERNDELARKLIRTYLISACAIALQFCAAVYF